MAKGKQPKEKQKKNAQVLFKSDTVDARRQKQDPSKIIKPEGKIFSKWQQRITYKGWQKKTG